MVNGVQEYFLYLWKRTLLFWPNHLSLYKHVSSASFFPIAHLHFSKSSLLGRLLFFFCPIPSVQIGVSFVPTSPSQSNWGISLKRPETLLQKAESQSLFMHYVNERDVALREKTDNCYRLFSFRIYSWNMVRVCGDGEKWCLSDWNFLWCSLQKNSTFNLIGISDQAEMWEKPAKFIYTTNFTITNL